MTKDTDYAWAAGFIDGEGCFSARRNQTGVTLSVTQVEREPLKRLHVLFGGNINGPRNPPSHRGRPFYVYTLSNKALYSQVEKLWPYLCKRKRMQYNESIDKSNLHVR
jgi:hypothetical protein